MSTKRIAESPTFARQKSNICTMKLSIIALLTLLLVLVACQSQSDAAEDAAAVMLDDARVLLAAKQYAAARDTILLLRQKYPTALQARRAAIVTLDSVELLQTRDSLACYEVQLHAAKEGFKQMAPRVDGQTNEAYYAQQRRVMQMEQHFDELCAKVKFYVRKIDIDLRENS